MVADPQLWDLREAGQKGLSRMNGARITAAWNASIYGIAIKVSEDGPISIFDRGKLVKQLGGSHGEKPHNQRNGADRKS